MTPAQRAKQKFKLKLIQQHLCRRCARPLSDVTATACEAICAPILKASAKQRYARYQAKGWAFTVAVIAQGMACGQREYR